MPESTMFALAFLAFELLIFVVSVWAGVKVITKAGYSGWWILVSFIPFVNFVMGLVFAFSKWPVTQRLEAAERASRSAAAGQVGWPPGGGSRGWAPTSGVPAGGRGTASSWDYLPR